MPKRSIAYNSALNFITQIIIIGITFISIPTIINGLGNEMFGLLSLLWLFVGYFSLFDFGMGQAAVKFLSVSVAKGDRNETAALIKFIIIFSLAVGILSGILTFFISLLGIENIFSVSPHLIHDANISLMLLALCLPAVILQATLKSVPQAVNRFDFLNLIFGLSGLFQWGGSVIVIWLGGRLLTIIVLTLCVRYVVVIVYLLFTVKHFPELAQKHHPMKIKEYLYLLKFGGWVSISQIIAPALTSLERIIITSTLSLTMLSYYVIPSDTVIRMLIIPMSIVSAILPTMSEVWATPDRKSDAKLLFQRSLKYVFIFMLPLVLVFIIFGDNILTLWIGKEYALKSDIVFIILSIGLLFNSLAQIPNTTLQALGSPDVAAKFGLFQTPIYLSLFYILTINYGIKGSAIAWLIRVAVEFAWLQLSTNRLMKSVPVSFNYLYIPKTFITAIVLFFALFFVRTFIHNEIVMLSSALILIGCYFLLLWRYIIDADDKLLFSRFKIIK